MAYSKLKERNISKKIEKEKKRKEIEIDENIKLLIRLE
jgi:hypothetical protein